MNLVCLIIRDNFMKHNAIKFILLFCLASIFFTFSITSEAFITKVPLSSDKAFTFSVSIQDTKHITLEGRMAPNYYIYRKHLSVHFIPQTEADVVLPKGIMKNDGIKSEAVFLNQVVVPITFAQPQQKLQMRIDYQGCSREGFCYPPMHKDIQLDVVTQNIQTKSATNTDLPAARLPVPASTFALRTLLIDQNEVKTVLGTYPMSFLLLIFAGLGLLLAFTPCILPMIPILLSIIVGQRKELISTRKAFFLSLAYVLGSALTYAFVGFTAAYLGHSLQVWLQTVWAIAIVSGLFVVLALSLFGLYELRIPAAWQHRMTQWSNQQQSGTYLGVFIMGTLAALIVSPCVTAPLVGVLMYISQTGDLLLGTSALFVMGIGMGIPLLLIGTSAGRWLPKSGGWMEIVKKVFGLLMLAMAVWLLARVIPTPFNYLNHDAFYSSKQSFIVVNDMRHFNQELLTARAEHKPVLLDFYADWCESCVDMDRQVFNTPNVKQQLNHYVLLRADLSANTTEEEAMLHYFNVMAPPTVLFFDNQGREINSRRIVGEINAKEFLARLNATRG